MKFEIGNRIRDDIKQDLTILDVKPGGMGVVYIVYDNELKSVYALKTYNEQLDKKDNSYSKRFLKEANNWLMIPPHQNIVFAPEIKKICGISFIVLEYVNGGDLSNWIGTPRLFENLPLLITFAIHFCDGILHAYQNGIVSHRDIKPQNCLITHDNVLKVTDFGISKTLETSNLLENVTGRQKENYKKGQELSDVSIIGSPLYMAPEVFDNQSFYGVSSDIYSFGILLFEMITGNVPFAASNYKECMIAHKTKKPPNLPEFASCLQRIVDLCLSKNITTRYNNFNQIREDLSSIYSKLSGKAFYRSPPAPSKRDDHFRMAFSLYNLGLYVEAFEIIKNIGMDQNDNSAYKLTKAELLIKLKGDWEKALDLCYDALNDSPEDLALMVQVAGILNVSGNYNEALILIEKALVADKNYDMAWNEKGNILSSLGKLTDAISCYERAIHLNPHFSIAWNNLGEAHRLSKNYEKSIHCFDKSISINHRDSKAWTNKGATLREQEKLDEALLCSLEALKLDSKSSKNWSNLALVHMKTGDSTKALKCFDTAIKIDPSFAEALFNKGALLVNEFNQIHEAILYFEKAKKLGMVEANMALNSLKTDLRNT